MNNLDGYFTAREQFDHPLEPKWARLIKEHQDVVCKVYWRIDSLVRSDPRESLLIRSTGQEIADPVDWDVRLDRFLVQRNIQAATLENEALRFGLILRDLMRPIGDTYGDGFYSKSLIKYLSNSPFASETPVKEILKSLAHRPDGTFDTSDAENAVRSAITSAATSLSESLHYSQSDAKFILIRAVANYVDVRFSYSVRRALGWAG